MDIFVFVRYFAVYWADIGPQTKPVAVIDELPRWCPRVHMLPFIPPHGVDDHFHVGHVTMDM